MSCLFSHYVPASVLGVKTIVVYQTETKAIIHTVPYMLYNPSLVSTNYGFHTESKPVVLALRIRYVFSNIHRLLAGSAYQTNLPLLYSFQSSPAELLNSHHWVSSNQRFYPCFYFITIFNANESISFLVAPKRCVRHETCTFYPCYYMYHVGHRYPTPGSLNLQMHSSLCCYLCAQSTCVEGAV